MLTRVSVHCAERIVATRSSSALEWRSSHLASGYSFLSSTRTARALTRFASILPARPRDVTGAFVLADRCVAGPAACARIFPAVRASGVREFLGRSAPVRAMRIAGGATRLDADRFNPRDTAAGPLAAAAVAARFAPRTTLPVRSAPRAAGFARFGPRVAAAARFTPRAAAAVAPRSGLRLRIG